MVGGHYIKPAGEEKGRKGRKLYRCEWCNVTGNYGLFTIIGQVDFCPENVASMNGYIWFNADDASVARMRASAQWHHYGVRAGYDLVGYREVTDTPGVCAAFTWRGQEYVVRYGKDDARGMNANDLRVELAGTQAPGTISLEQPLVSGQHRLMARDRRPVTEQPHE